MCQYCMTFGWSVASQIKWFRCTNKIIVSAADAAEVRAMLSNGSFPVTVSIWLWNVCEKPSINTCNSCAIATIIVLQCRTQSARAKKNKSRAR